MLSALVQVRHSEQPAVRGMHDVYGQLAQATMSSRVICTSWHGPRGLRASFQVRGWLLPLALRTFERFSLEHLA